MNKATFLVNYKQAGKTCVSTCHCHSMKDIDDMVKSYKTRELCSQITDVHYSLIKGGALVPIDNINQFSKNM